MFPTKLAIAVFAFALAGNGIAKPVPVEEYPPSAEVLRPKNVTVEEFKAQFFDLCPGYYGESEVTDRPAHVFTAIEESLDDDSFKGRKADASCIYQYPTTEYQNIAVDVAMALGGDGVVTIGV